MAVRIGGNATIRVIPHSEQEYNTVGNWHPGKRRGDPIEIEISEMRDSRSIVMVAGHEMIEAGICEEEGIKERDVSAFDKKFEREREMKKHGRNAEPGNDPRAPYGPAHRCATKVERFIGGHLGMEWAEHEKEVSRVSSTWKEGRSLLRDSRG